ncbi:hypothetical protein D3C87_2189640 [compost metagenome]
MPVSRKALHAIKAIVDNPRHHFQRQLDDGVEDEKAQHHAGDTQGDNHGEGA